MSDLTKELAALVSAVELSVSGERVPVLYREPASAEQLDLVEAAVGHRLPADARWLLGLGAYHQSWTAREPVRRGSAGDVVLGFPLSVWELAHYGNASSRQAGKPIDLKLYQFPFSDDLYEFAEHAELERPAEELIADLCPQLVPLSMGMHGSLLLLDFRHDPVAPPVINIRPDDLLGPPHPGLPVWAWYVAPSVTELLKNMHADYDTAKSMPIEPYEFADEFDAWEKSFDGYLAQWTDTPFQPRWPTLS